MAFRQFPPCSHPCAHMPAVCAGMPSKRRMSWSVWPRPTDRWEPPAASSSVRSDGCGALCACLTLGNIACASLRVLVRHAHKGARRCNLMCKIEHSCEQALTTSAILDRSYTCMGGELIHLQDLDTNRRGRSTASPADHPGNWPNNTCLYPISTRACLQKVSTVALWPQRSHTHVLLLDLCQEKKPKR